MTTDERNDVLPRIDTAPLDDPVGESLRGHHAHLARRAGAAISYIPGVATFSAVDTDGDPHRWDDLVRLLGGGAFADMFSCPAPPPPHWESVFALEGRQMIYAGGGHVDDRPESGFRLVELGTEAVPEMLDLISRTRPGPFGPRTHELGTYLGVRDGDGALVAMAGERLRPPGWTEISAVCTAPETRGRGHAARLVSELVSRITTRGDRPFLHVAETNTGAIALYERLGFETRALVTFRGFRTP